MAARLLGLTSPCSTARIAVCSTAVSWLHTSFTEQYYAHVVRLSDRALSRGYFITGFGEGDYSPGISTGFRPSNTLVSINHTSTILGKLMRRSKASFEPSADQAGSPIGAAATVTTLPL